MSNNPQEIVIKQKAEMAIKNGYKIVFDYVKKDLTITKNRVCIPQSITYTPDGELDRLYATDTKDGGLRGFMFDGIQEMRILDESEDKVSER